MPLEGAVAASYSRADSRCFEHSTRVRAPCCRAGYQGEPALGNICLPLTEALKKTDRGGAVRLLGENNACGGGVRDALG